MTEAVNNLARLSPEVGWIAGIIQQDATGVAPTLAYQSGFDIVDQPQVSFVRNSAGNYTLTVQNFQGLNGQAIVGAVTPMTTGADFIAQYTYSYSGATATITVLTFTTSTPADCSVSFDFKAI